MQQDILQSQHQFEDSEICQFLASHQGVSCHPKWCWISLVPLQAEHLAGSGSVSIDAKAECQWSDFKHLQNNPNLASKINHNKIKYTSVKNKPQNTSRNIYNCFFFFSSFLCITFAVFVLQLHLKLTKNTKKHTHMHTCTVTCTLSESLFQLYMMCAFEQSALEINKFNKDLSDHQQKNNCIPISTADNH